MKASCSNPITIRPSMFRGLTVHISKNWVSNGSWLINKKLVKNKVLFETEETVRAAMKADFVSKHTDKHFADAIGKAKERTHEMQLTHISIRDGRTNLRLLRNGTVVRWADESYIKDFGLETYDSFKTNPDKTGVIVHSTGDFGLMPYRITRGLANSLIGHSRMYARSDRKLSEI